MSRGQTHGGKGDKQRPTAGTFADNWDNIFNKKKDKISPNKLGVDEERTKEVPIPTLPDESKRYITDCEFKVDKEYITTYEDTEEDDGGLDNG